ncbi:hypothetical protein H9W91_17360 [Streptomyces alfalfae]|uniref:phage tail protein n=1 Tax=Streptomyces alfalfae TaxID=1642299 RepID=UPI001BABC900|nr:hypothetical protein [Streptomyces alfalfae]QUI32431.1 hypothetical protein H9W91_17360 [Streptomyces alfalfae]
MTTLASMTVRLGIDTDQLRAGAERAKSTLSGLGKAVAGLGVGVPVAAAVAAGVGGMAAAFASAGLAAKAFQLAVGPQMEAVSEAASLAEEAEKAAASGAEDAAEKQKAYTDALADMPPHTRAMAKEFIGLKKDYSAWSDSLSSSTMPVFTKGLQVARRLLPLLTPFVKEAAKAFGEFVDEIDRSTRGKGLESFAKSMAKVAGRNLKSFLFGLKNIAVGIGGVIKAFLPLSDEMSGGFEESTAAFAKWGQGLSNSEGFAQFVALARQGAQTLGTLVQAALKLAVALAPLIGVAATVALTLARIINALPPPAVQALATAILVAVVAFKAFKAASTAVDTASALIDSRLGRLARRHLATAATAVKANARIAASAIASAARTAAAWTGAAIRAMATFAAQMIRTAAIAIRQFVLMAARAVVWAATMAAQWLIAMGPIGWIIAAVIALVALVIANWDRVKAWTIAAWNGVVAAVQMAVNMVLAGVRWLAQIPGMVADWFNEMKLRAIVKALELAVWISTLPGRIRAGLASLLGVLRSAAVNAFVAFRNAAVTRAASFISWVRGLPGRIARGIGSLAGLLVGKGKDVVRGLWQGIKSMGGWLKSTLISWAKSIVPGPIAKALNIGSPSKLMADEIGRWIPAGIAVGAEDAAPAMQRSLQGLVDVPGLTTMARSGAAGAAARQAVDVRITVDGPEAVKRLIRSIVAVDGRGDVQTAFGK